jgi:hypothetical protein
MTAVSAKTYRLSGGTAGCTDLTDDGFGQLPREAIPFRLQLVTEKAA